MAPRNVIASTIILLAKIAKAAVVQHPLQARNLDLSYHDAFALEKLIDAVGDQLFNATPIGQQCYKPYFNESGPCNFTSGLRTNDSWTTDQPGGYFYVREALDILRATTDMTSGQPCSMSSDRRNLCPPSQRYCYTCRRHLPSRKRSASHDRAQQYRHTST